MHSDYLEIHKHRNSVRKKRITIFLLSFVFIFIIVSGSFKLIDKYFLIYDVKITGVKRINKEVFLNKTTDFVRQSIKDSGLFIRMLGGENLLSWYFADWEKFAERDSNLASLESNFDFLNHSISFILEERKPRAIWCLGDRCFWFDDSGKILEEVSQMYSKLVLKIRDNSNRVLNVGGYILENKKLVRNLNSILNLLEDYKSIISNIILNELYLEELSVYLDNGPRIDFSLRFDPSINKEVLKSLIKKTEREFLEYIDLRVENRVYYR